jgi:hypothetical protein
MSRRFLKTKPYLSNTHVKCLAPELMDHALERRQSSSTPAFHGVNLLEDSDWLAGVEFLVLDRSA